MLLGGGSFLVTLTPTGATTGTIDKTYNEIKTALENGQIPIINVVANGTYMFTCLFHAFTNDYIEFSHNEYMPDETALFVRMKMIEVLPDSTTQILNVEFEISLNT